MQVDTLAVNCLQLAGNYSYGTSLGSVTANDSVQIISYDEAWSNLVGDNITASLTDQRDYQFVHEAGVYLPSTDKIYVASNFVDPNTPNNVTVLDAKTYKATEEREYPGLHMPNGADIYNETHIVFAVFGNLDVPSSVSLLNPETEETTTLVSSYYGRNFTAINDVRVNHADGSVWFTDSWYGHLLGFRPPPDIPNQIYRFDPRTGHVRAMADAFSQPNGLEFSADFKTLYLADSGYIQGKGNFNGTRPSTIYAFDVADNGFLMNRRMFAYSGNPFVDGMHVDAKGNVWSTSGKGITVWSPEGTMLGEIRVDTEVNNFMFVPEGILVLAFTKIYLVECDVRARPRSSG